MSQRTTMLDTTVQGTASAGFSSRQPLATFQAIGSVSAATGSAVVTITASNDDVNYITLGTITLTLGTSATSDGFAVNAPWGTFKATATTLTGTNATVKVIMGTVG